MFGRKTKNPSSFLPLAEETKGRKPSAVPLFFASHCAKHTQRNTIIFLHCNGSTRLRLLGFNAAAVQPVQQLNRTVPRTTRHFSERIALLTTLCHRVCDMRITEQFKNVNSFLGQFTFFVGVILIRTLCFRLDLYETTMKF